MDAHRKVKQRSKEDCPTFWGYFEQWSRRPLPSSLPNRGAFNLIGELMGRNSGWCDVDSAFYLKLLDKMYSRGYSRNYISATVAKLHAVMASAYKLKYHDNTEFQQFNVPPEYTESIYLTQEEIDRLISLPLANRRECRARDLFIVGIYTAARFSDYSRLSSDNLNNGFICFTQQKTAESVIIPASPKVLSIMERYGGKVPYLHHTTFNKLIKVICRKAGICSHIQISRSRGLRHITETKEKWELVTAHTARRTGATLLYMSGVPVHQCMLITGHKSEASFRRYIRITKEENARLLASNPFFQ